MLGHVLVERLAKSGAEGCVFRTIDNPIDLLEVVGIGIMLVILWMAWRGTFGPDYYAPVEVSGLYWHFVDIVWIFLFPLLYLLGAHFGPGH